MKKQKSAILRKTLTRERLNRGKEEREKRNESLCSEVRLTISEAMERFKLYGLPFYPHTAYTAENADYNVCVFDNVGMAWCESVYQIEFRHNSVNRRYVFEKFTVVKQNRSR